MHALQKFALWGMLAWMTYACSQPADPHNNINFEDENTVNDQYSSDQEQSSELDSNTDLSSPNDSNADVQVPDDIETIDSMDQNSDLYDTLEDLSELTDSYDDLDDVISDLSDLSDVSSDVIDVIDVIEDEEDLQDAEASWECHTDNDCPLAITGACDVATGYCLSCENHFDCHNPEQPFCDSNINQCGQSDICVGDDERDLSTCDDGPAGAWPLNIPSDILGKICSVDDAEEADWYVFDITLPGSGVEISLDWTNDTADLDLEVYDENGQWMGQSWFLKPEVVVLTYLPRGKYYVKITRYSPSSTTTTAYELVLEDRGSAQCSSAAQCAENYQTQVFRGHCQSDGACHWIVGQGSLNLGELCDSSDDCSSGLCLYGAHYDGFDYVFIKDAHLKARCLAATCAASQYCSGDELCSIGYCQNACEIDDHCPVRFDQVPLGNQAWFRPQCGSTGICQ